MATVSLNQHDRILHDRYTLTRRLYEGAAGDSWLAVDQEGGQVLVKCWPYEDDRPNEVVRALWDRELRNLFRLSSSPDADSRLVVLRDAGVDKRVRCFLMVLSAPGFEPLRHLLANRAKCDWLRDMRQLEVRVPLWRATRELALGLAHLHQQQMLHRALSPDCIFADTAAGSESLRLGGFEWTVKVGQNATGGTRDMSATAPETVIAGVHPHTFESDWYQFGCLLAQLFASVEAPLAEDAKKHSALLARVREASKLTDGERDLIGGLLESNPELRISRGFEILAAIDDIIVRLDQPARFVENSYLALAVLLGPTRRLTEAITEIDDSISALDTEAQRLFVQRDLETPRIIARPSSSGGAYLLQGNRLVYFLKEYSEPGSQPSGQWDLAFTDSNTEIRYSSGSEA